MGASYFKIIEVLNMYNYKQSLAIFCCIISLAFLGLVSCISYDLSRPVTEQGNFIPIKKIKRLKTGMTKEDVAILLGSSIISPTFDNNTWHYVYTKRVKNNNMKIRHLTLEFTNNRLKTINKN